MLKDYILAIGFAAYFFCMERIRSKGIELSRRLALAFLGLGSILCAIEDDQELENIYEMIMDQLYEDEDEDED